MREPLVHPDRAYWSELIRRPAFPTEDRSYQVKKILEEVRSQGDQAVLAYTRKYDYPHAQTLRVSRAAMENAAQRISEPLKAAIEVAIQNICTFHQAQWEAMNVIETLPGVHCWRKSVPIEKVGLYIPGGRTPLFSTLLMLAIPAQLAGCKEIIVCTPPDAEGYVASEILYVAHRLGLEKVFACGGAQAIGAMAFGTESIPAVHKILGPGNAYVTQAKQEVQTWGIAIDMPAGPSEVLVIAEKDANPRFVAADLLSQAEHGPDSHVVLVTEDLSLAQKVQSEILTQLASLPRQTVIQEALKHAQFIVFTDRQTMVDFSNAYAPEHLIVHAPDTSWYESRILNAGSVFLGPYTPESAGDYASGTNHTLPTYGYAKMYSGVSLDSFVKKITFQRITPQGLSALGPTLIEMATAEKLHAHAHAVRLRLQNHHP